MNQSKGFLLGVVAAIAVVTTLGAVKPTNEAAYERAIQNAANEMSVHLGLSGPDNKSSQDQCAKRFQHWIKVAEQSFPNPE